MLVGGVSVLNLTTGTSVRDFDTSGVGRLRGLAATELPDGSIAVVATDDGDPDTRIFMFNAASGNQLWSTVFLSNIYTVRVDSVDGVLFVNAGQSVAAVSTMTGAVQWMSDETFDYDITSITLIGTGIFASSQTLSVLMDRSGETIMSWDFQVNPSWALGSPVFFATFANTSARFAVTYGVFAVDLATGNTLWEFNTDDMATSIGFRPGDSSNSCTVLVARDHSLLELSADTGEVVRSFDFELPVASTLADKHGNILVMWGTANATLVSG